MQMQRINVESEKGKKRGGVLIYQFGVSLGCEWNLIDVRDLSLGCRTHFASHVPKIRGSHQIDYDPPCLWDS